MLSVKTTRNLALCSAFSLILAACGVFGGGKNSPDEFIIVKKAPLAMPPEFNLRPPKPGEPRPQELGTTAQAIAALFPGRTTLPPPSSAGETALLSALENHAPPEPGVRSNVGDDTTIVVDKGILLRDVLATGERQLDADGVEIERLDSRPIPN